MTDHRNKLDLRIYFECTKQQTEIRHDEKANRCQNNPNRVDNNKRNAN